MFILYLLLIAVLAGSGSSIDALANSSAGSDAALTGGLVAVMVLVFIAMFLVMIWAYSTWYQAANKQVDTGTLQITDFLSLKNIAGLMAVYFLSIVVVILGFFLLIIRASLLPSSSRGCQPSRLHALSYPWAKPLVHPSRWQRRMLE